MLKKQQYLTLNQASFDAGYLDGVTHWTLAAGMTGAETTGLPSGATVEAQADLTAALTIGVTNAATGTNDAVTVLLSEGAGTDYTSVAIADVEEITVDVTEELQQYCPRSYIGNGDYEISHNKACTDGQICWY